MNFLYLNSNTMGSGDRDLGKKLLVSFLTNLAESGTPVHVIGCVNDGVKLTTREGPALDALKKLEASGARIATCGTCLDYHGLRNDLRIGEVGSMKQTIEIMTAADRMINPC